MDPKANLIRLINDGKTSPADIRTFIITHKPRLRANINESNYKAETPLICAIRRESMELVTLLRHQFRNELAINIDCVLLAIKTGNQKFIGEFLQYIETWQAGLEVEAVGNDSDFFDWDLTALEFAAIENNYEAVALLLSRGHGLRAIPHRADCKCAECREQRQNGEPMEQVLHRLNFYRAISSPAYLCHTVDPVHAAFALANDLEKCAEIEDAYGSEYEKLQEQVSKFSAAMVGHCRNSEDVLEILRRGSSDGASATRLPGLHKALQCNQKEFVANLNFQKVVEAQWLGDWSDWQITTPRVRMLRYAMHTLLYPLMALLTLLIPYQGGLIKSCHFPFTKYLRFATSYLVFVGMLIYETVFAEASNVRGPPGDAFTWYIALYVVGLAWMDFKCCWRVGFKRFFTSWWHYIDVLLIAAFVTTFCLWLWAWMDVNVTSSVPVERMKWHLYDANLLAEGFFAVSTLLAVWRCFYMLQFNSYLGPMLLSLAHCIRIAQWFVVLLLINGFTFGVALSYNYQGYAGEQRPLAPRNWDNTTVKQSVAFQTLASSAKFLYWSFYGYIHPAPNVEVIIGDLSGDPNNPVYHYHSLVALVGEALLGTYNLIQMVILLNLMVAVMITYATTIFENAITEWKFISAQIWAEYFEDDTTIPPPFNLLPSARSIAAACCGVQPDDDDNQDGADKEKRCNFFDCCFFQLADDDGRPKTPAEEKKAREGKLEQSPLTRRLVAQYLSHEYCVKSCAHSDDQKKSAEQRSSEIEELKTKAMKLCEVVDAAVRRRR